MVFTVLARTGFSYFGVGPPFRPTGATVLWCGPSLLDRGPLSPHQRSPYFAAFFGIRFQHHFSDAIFYSFFGLCMDVGSLLAQFRHCFTSFWHQIFKHRFRIEFFIDLRCFLSARNLNIYCIYNSFVSARLFRKV